MDIELVLHNIARRTNDPYKIQAQKVSGAVNITLLIANGFVTQEDDGTLWITQKGYEYLKQVA